MFQKTVFMTLTLLTMLFCAVIADAQSSALDTAKTKARITKLGVGADVTVAERGGKTFHGSIGQIGPDTFTISEVDLKANVEIRYDQVKRLEKGYSPASPITGQRTSPKTRKIIGFVALGAAVVAIIALIAILRDPNF